MILEAIDKDEGRKQAMAPDDRFIISLGLLVIAGAIWVLFGIGNDSWTNWMMGGTGAVLIAWRLVRWLGKRVS